MVRLKAQPLTRRDPLVTEVEPKGPKVPLVFKSCDPAPLCPFTTQSPRCVCSSTPPGQSWGGWPGWELWWRDPGCGWVGPWEAAPTASSRGSIACGLGWRTRPPACWASNTSSSPPPGRCSLSARRRVCMLVRGKKRIKWTKNNQKGIIPVFVLTLHICRYCPKFLVILKT